MARPPKRPFAKAVLEDATTRHDRAEMDPKMLRTAQASIRLARWRRRQSPAAADEAGEGGGQRLDLSLTYRRKD